MNSCGFVWDLGREICGTKDLKIKKSVQNLKGNNVRLMICLEVIYSVWFIGDIAWCALCCVLVWFVFNDLLH